MTSLIAAMLITLPAFAIQERPAAAGERASMPLVALHGAESHIADAQFRRVTSAKEWRSLWLEHLNVPAGGIEDLAAEVPEVDFERCMVIAIFTGKGWNSHGVRCEGVLEREGQIVVRFDQRSYQTAGPDGGGVRVQPFGAFVLPRSEKPVVIEENVQGLKDHPDKWKQRAEFEALRAQPREN